MRSCPQRTWLCWVVMDQGCAVATCLGGGLAGGGPEWPLLQVYWPHEAALPASRPDWTWEPVTAFRQLRGRATGTGRRAPHPHHIPGPPWCPRQAPLQAAQTHGADSLGAGHPSLAVPPQRPLSAPAPPSQDLLTLQTTPEHGRPRTSPRALRAPRSPVGTVRSRDSEPGRQLNARRPRGRQVFRQGAPPGFLGPPRRESGSLPAE